MALIYRPVYEDTYYTTTASTLEYQIFRGSDLIFSGRAVRMPSQDSIRINVNKVCQDYLWQNIEFPLSSTQTHTNAAATFYLKNAAGTTLQDYRFIDCYDYDFEWTGTTGTTLSDPICDVYAEGVKVPTTKVSGSTREIKTTFATPVNTTCAQYALIYVNARGGWDTFVIQGTAKKKDAITQYTMDKAFDNQTREFEAFRYISEIKTSYELNTHYLTDEQSQKLAKHLIGSNLVYLQDLDSGDIKPVLITDTTANYQTYQTNGKKMAQYKINVVESQSKIRRG